METINKISNTIIEIVKTEITKDTIYKKDVEDQIRRLQDLLLEFDK